MNIKKIRPGEFAVVRYFESVKDEFPKYGLELIATLTEFKVVSKGEEQQIFICDTIAGVAGFLRGLMYGAKA